MNTHPLQLVLEQGKDWGLSVIGTREQLLGLALSLNRALEGRSEPETESSPVQVLEAPVLSPYSDRPAFYMVFCVVAPGGASRVMGAQLRSGPGGAVLVGAAALCIIGLIAIARWALHAL
jgi:hypothetical protein